MLKIYNKIFESAIYPEFWAKGLIVPIHKKGDKGNPNKYRGITLVSTFAKIARPQESQLKVEFHMSAL